MFDAFFPSFDVKFETYVMVWRGVWGPLRFKSGPPVIQGSKVLPFNLSVSYIIPWNSLNGEMNEGYIWVRSTIKTNRKQNASNGKFQTISKIKLV